MKWIENIVKVKPYIITCKWNDGVVSEIDLTDFVYSYSKIQGSSYSQLLDKTRFAEVKCDGTTLYWEDGLEFEDYDGLMKKGPLDIAPEVLYDLRKKKEFQTKTK